MSNKSSLLNILTIFSLLLFSASCQYPQPVRQALMQSGENKAELEKVLKHYGHGRQQALHLKAAEFLIAEMPGHYSYESKTMSRFCFSEKEGVLYGLTLEEELPIVKFELE